MDHSFNPPGQNDLLPDFDATEPTPDDLPVPEAAEETSAADEILNDFAAPGDDALFAAEDLPAEDIAAEAIPEEPSVDDILNEFSAPEAIPDETDLPDAGAIPEDPSVDEILREFSAPETAPDEEGSLPEPALPADVMADETVHIDDILQEFGTGGLPAAAPEAPADPLETAESLPNLFPADYAAEQAPAPEPDEEPTVVRRPPQKKRSTARKVLHVFAVIGKYLLGLVIALVIAVAGLFGYLTLTEYNPAHAEIAERGAVNVSKKLDKNTFTVLTLNTGYGALGKDADFFMDGGKGVRGESKERVTDNMSGIEAIVRSADADFVFLQEVDTDSARSFGLNQWLQYEHDLEDYETRFALNYSCKYVPYPIPNTIGRVHSGIATFSRYDISSATRYSLPCPFSWPTRIANLKRCMLVTRIPIDGSEGKELVLVNFHLEAYDDGEGKAAQTEQLMNYLLEEYEKGNYVIAGGDFNQCFPGTQDTYPLKPTSEWAAGQLDRLPTGWKYACDDSTPTCRLLNQPYDPSSPLTQYYVIDGFIISPNVSLNSVKTLNEGFVYTDHNPVLMEITLNP